MLWVRRSHIMGAKDAGDRQLAKQSVTLSPRPPQLLLEHHKEHWVTVRRHFKADRDRNMERYEHRLAALVPSLPPDDDAAAAALAPMEL